MTRARVLPTRLSTRLVILMTLALLPLGLISIWQTRVVVQETDSLARAALLAETVQEATAERELIQQALGVALGLAGTVLILEPEECRLAMRDFVDQYEPYIFAGFVPNDGYMTCSSADEPMDLTQLPNFEEAIARDGAFVEINEYGAASAQPVLIVSQPVRDVDGQIGRFALSIPHGHANKMMTERGIASGLKLASINAEGELVASAGGNENAENFLPRDVAFDTLPSRAGDTFRAVSGDGRDRLFAVAPMIEDTLFLVGSWPNNRDDGSGAVWRARLATVFPALMWVAGIAVAVFGIQRLVLRHIGDLRSAMRRFALGERGGEGLTMDDPPRELEEAGRAFNRMALIVSEVEARQEADLHEKEVLLREVHHRVKNNLQLIASIMNMQMRRATSEEAKSILIGLQQRVSGLAMLHRTIYSTSEMSTTDSAQLIRAVIKDTSTIVQDLQWPIEHELEPLMLYPDQAVALSMLLAEALTNAFKYSDRESSDPVRITLEATGETTARLRISNPVSNAPQVTDKDTGDKLGSRLIRSFVRQLDGSHTSEVIDGKYIFEVNFERRTFEAAADAA